MVTFLLHHLDYGIRTFKCPNNHTNATPCTTKNTPPTLRVPPHSSSAAPHQIPRQTPRPAVQHPQPDKTRRPHIRRLQARSSRVQDVFTKQRQWRQPAFPGPENCSTKLMGEQLQKGGFCFVSLMQIFPTFLQKRQLAKAASSSQTSTPNKNDSPLQLDQLPLNTLVIVASQLPFDDFKRIGFVSKKLNSVSL